MEQRKHILVLFWIILFMANILHAADAATNSVSKQPVATTPGQVDIADIQSLDLETARRFAIMQNPTLAAAEARVQQAKELIIQARSAYWPSLDASYSVSREWLSDTEYHNRENPNDPEDHFRTGITAEWVLFDGFEREFLNTRARLSGMEAMEAGDDARRLILLAVAES